MTYRLIGDSCTDLDENLKRDDNVRIVPLTLEIGDYQVIDDNKFNQKDFIKRMAESKIGAKSACPSPEAFKEAMECDVDMVFVVTLSEHLSGSYQSAEIGKKLYEEEHDSKNILVLSSKSASAGQYRLMLELDALCKQGLKFEEISKRIIELRDDMKTYFVLESLDTLRKNGRLSAVKALIASALNIKPIMGAINGVIVKKDQQRGIQKALSRMVELAINEAGENSKDKIVCITHINNEERGESVAKLFRKSNRFKDVKLVNGAGVATMYAGDGGIVLAIG
ncbi:DegV family protein [Lachnoanaerobaculum umeaense]|jgi:DegV family protein|uniref:DegV family protein n=1 Tax=Lachnoanaerobaculum umeaense TaxID=617123 RepID=A0A385Q133_9FIRM|nr:DegV family protein [Lachnoanaerobaculum umeaense]AYA99284.1 DegV family protein [Lachnoanaerobaculum umeaense]PZW94306.1 DegV family protein with EDD domain [Lachnoanaerobaculum umeaense]